MVTSKILKRERLGLLLIAASLGVIVMINVLLLRAERDDHRAHNRVQGLSLVRLLSRMNMEEIVGTGAGRSALDVVRQSQGNPDFAYAVLVDLDERTIVEVTAPGAIVPRAPVPLEPSGWIDEVTFPPDGSGRSIHEYFAPVLELGERVAHLRIGFYEPSLASLMSGMRFFATLSLLIFLLTPLSYFLLQREIRPLQRATGHLRELTCSDRPGVLQMEAGGELLEFIEAFNAFVALAAERSREASLEQQTLLAASRVLSFQKARMEEILDSLPFAVAVLDEAGTTTFASVKLEALLGVAPRDAMGRSPQEWPAPDEARAFLAGCAGGSRGNGPRRQRVEVALGTERTLSLSAHGLASGGGTLLLACDSSVESQARRSQAEFVTHVAHELKSPLNVFAMYSEALLGSEGRSEEFRIEACNVLKDEVERLSTLVNTLLSIARIEMGSVTVQRSRLRLDAFLEEILVAVSRAGRGNELRFHVETPPSLSKIHVDKELLRVALNNLLTNAVKYSRADGEVVLGAEESRDELRIFVRDQGIGIREEDLHRVFEKFFRSESPEVKTRSGHGLGLSLVKEIADLHGARVNVQSVPDEGSEFTLVFSKNPVLLGGEA